MYKRLKKERWIEEKKHRRMSTWCTEHVSRKKQKEESARGSERERGEKEAGTGQSERLKEKERKRSGVCLTLQSRFQK